MWATFHFSGFDGGKINSLQEEGRGEEAAAAGFGGATAGN